MTSPFDQRIKSAYQWLSQHYRAGDRIFLFGEDVPIGELDIGLSEPQAFREARIKCEHSLR